MNWVIWLNVFVAARSRCSTRWCWLRKRAVFFGVTVWRNKFLVCVGRKITGRIFLIYCVIRSLRNIWKRVIFFVRLIWCLISGGIWKFALCFIFINSCWWWRVMLRKCINWKGRGVIFLLTWVMSYVRYWSCYRVIWRWWMSSRWKARYAKKRCILCASRFSGWKDWWSNCWRCRK